MAVIHRRHRAAGIEASLRCLSTSSEATASSLATAINSSFSQWSRSINWKLISRTGRKRRSSSVRRYAVLPCPPCCDGARKTETAFVRWKAGDATATGGGRRCLVSRRTCCRRLSRVDDTHLVVWFHLDHSDARNGKTFIRHHYSQRATDLQHKLIAYCFALQPDETSSILV